MQVVFFGGIRRTFIATRPFEDVSTSIWAMKKGPRRSNGATEDELASETSSSDSDGGKADAEKKKSHKIRAEGD